MQEQNNFISFSWTSKLLCVWLDLTWLEWSQSVSFSVLKRCRLAKGNETTKHWWCWCSFKALAMKLCQCNALLTIACQLEHLKRILVSLWVLIELFHQLYYIILYYIAHTHAASEQSLSEKRLMRLNQTKRWNILVCTHTVIYNFTEWLYAM